MLKNKSEEQKSEEQKNDKLHSRNIAMTIVIPLVFVLIVLQLCLLTYLTNN